MSVVQQPLGEGQRLSPWRAAVERLAGLPPAAGAWFALGVLVIIASSLSSAFLQSGNLRNVLVQSAPLGVVAIGQTLVILTGGIDVSVGSVVSLTAVIAGRVMASDNRMVLPTILLVFGVGLTIGLINGILIAKIHTDPFVTTLGMLLVAQGANLLYTNASPSGRLTPDFRQLAEGKVVGIPVPVILLAAFFALFLFILRKTVWGRRLYAIGGNNRAAYLSGVSVARAQISTYVISSLCAVVAGLLLVARTGIGDNWSGRGMELDSIAAVMIGGTALGGGRGGVSGTIAGVFFLGATFNLLNLLGVSAYAQAIVKGIVIIVGVAIYSRRATQ
jgi:ribose/xylose/arabinose/galactoside ABC-type transport system permease subunit